MVWLTSLTSHKMIITSSAELHTVMFGLLFLLVAAAGTVSASCDANYPYRLINGTCNNLRKPTLASANTTMPRLINARGRETDDEPNERTVTRTFMSDYDRGEFDADLDAKERATGTTVEGRGLNAYAIILLQFLSHDISLMPLTSFFNQAVAFGIDIPNCNVKEDAGVSDELCALATVRNVPTLQNKLVTRDSIQVMGSDGYLAPINRVSSYIDLNPVYGSDEKTASTLRDRLSEKGKLIIGPNDELPQNNPSANIFTENECDLFGPSSTSHMAGDVRVDENFVLTAVHLLFLRQHNRIADELATANPSWGDEKLYQESRKRNIAIFQHIIYDEVLPRIYGTEATEQILGHYQGYDSSVDASATTEFSTAAFRLHSMVNLPALFLSDTCEMNKGVIFESPATDVPYVKQERTNCDPADFRRVGHEDVIRGALIQHAQEYDNHVTHTLMNIRIGASGNVDVQAANIFRGRQHSLGTIDNLRTAVGLPSVFDNPDTDRRVRPRVSRRGSPNGRAGGGRDDCVEGTEVECFRRLVANVTLAKQMHSIYGHVDNVDPYVALVGEKHAYVNKGPKKSSSMGETSTLVTLDQLKKIRDGDRFWYEAEGIFSPDELLEIKELTLSDILKANFPELAYEIPSDALQTMQSNCLKTNMKGGRKPSWT